MSQDKNGNEFTKRSPFLSLRLIRAVLVTGAGGAIGGSAGGPKVALAGGVGAAIGALIIEMTRK